MEITDSRLSTPYDWQTENDFTDQNLGRALGELTAEQMLVAYESIIQTKPASTTHWTDRGDWGDMCDNLKTNYPELHAFIGLAASSEHSRINDINGLAMALLILSRIASTEGLPDPR